MGTEQSSEPKREGLARVSSKARAKVATQRAADSKRLRPRSKEGLENTVHFRAVRVKGTTDTGGQLKGMTSLASGRHEEWDEMEDCWDRGL